jgi:hypothetical protein
MEFKMIRWIMIAVCMLFATMPIANAQSTVEDEPIKEILTRMDAILKQLESFEKRIAKLELMNVVGPRVWTDQNGIFLYRSGDAIGIWGIDVSPTPAVR